MGFGILAVAAGSYLAARESPLFAISTIEVEGAPPGVRAEVRRALDRDLGTSLLAVSGDEAIRRAEALPDVISATYDRQFPHTLRIVVQAERPVAVVRRGSDSWLVSARARVLASVGRRDRPGLPRLWLPHAAAVAVGEILADDGGGIAARALARLRAAPLGGVRGAVLSRGAGLVFVLRSGVEIRLGQPVDVGLKLAIARRIVPLLPPGTAVLDLTVPVRPVSETNPRPGS